MSISASSRAVFLALVWAAVPELGTAQTVVVRHSVTADIAPVLVVRDSGWTTPATDTTRLVWSGEIRANTVVELQVMGRSERDEASYARSTDGAWVQLQPGTWNTIAIASAGRRRVELELIGSGSREAPRVRVITR